MQNAPATRARKRKAFSSARMQDPQLWERAAWLSSIYTEDKTSFVPVQEYCDTFTKHHGFHCGYRDMWNILKLAFPSVEKVRRGRKYVYWGIKRNSAQRPEKRSRKQTRGKTPAADIESKRKGISTRSKETKAEDFSVQEMHDDTHSADQNVNFIVHLGTSRVVVEHEPPQAPEMPAPSSADDHVVALPRDEADRCRDDAAGLDGDLSNSRPCMVTVTDASVQTPNMEQEPVTSSTRDDACANGESRDSVPTRWTGEEAGRPVLENEAEGHLRGVRVKQEPFWGSEDDEERPTFVSADAFSSAPRASVDSPAPALVPFPADNPPSASSIERLKECIDRIPQESLICKHTTFSALSPSVTTRSSLGGEIAPVTLRRLFVSPGRSPSPRPIQVSVGTQHMACAEKAGFSSLRVRSVLDEPGQGNRLISTAACGSGLDMFSGRGKTGTTSGNCYQNEDVSLTSENVPLSVGAGGPEVTSTVKLSSDHLSSDKDSLPMIVSVMSYADPESNETNPAHAQGATALTTHQNSTKPQRQNTDACVRSEIQSLRDGLLEERRLRRSAEAQLSKCMVQLRRQRAVSEQLAEALKPFIFKKQT